MLKNLQTFRHDIFWPLKIKCDILMSPWHILIKIKCVIVMNAWYLLLILPLQKTRFLTNEKSHVTHKTWPHVLERCHQLSHEERSLKVLQLEQTLHFSGFTLISGSSCRHTLGWRHLSRRHQLETATSDRRRWWVRRRSSWQRSLPGFCSFDLWPLKQ